ncbi:MAG: hypothetical protein ABSF21_00140 [Dehalococcoidia bacterium]|jgi:hypothetical protein
MTQLLMTPEGKKVIINTEHDDNLYEAPRNPPNTGTRFTSGTNLYAHKSRTGTVYFYTYSWSMWEGHEDNYELVSVDDAKKFILERSTEARRVAGGVDKPTCLKYFPGLFEEDA